MKLCLLLYGLLAGCTTLEVLKNPGAPVPKLIQQAEDEIDQEQFAEALKNLQFYQHDEPAGPFQSRVRLDTARAQLGEGHTSEAVQDLQRLLHEKLGTDQAVVAQCSFYSALGYLKLGEDLKAKASFLDAERLSGSLPPEIALAEIPAHLAVIYRQEEDWNLSKVYSMHAQSGVERIFASDERQDLTPQREALLRKRKAALYFNMGSYADSSAAGDPLKTLQGLETLQFYLLRAIELSDPVWSPRAQKDLEQSYRQIWNVIATSQEDRAARLKALTTNLEKLKALSPAFEPPTLEKETFAQLEVLQQRAEHLMLQDPAGPLLTPEAISRESLHKDGLIKSSPYFQSEKNPARAKPSDPNLERP